MKKDIAKSSNIIIIINQKSVLIIANSVLFYSSFHSETEAPAITVLKMLLPE